jgi:hypothetical protein
MSLKLISEASRPFEPDTGSSRKVGFSASSVKFPITPFFGNLATARCAGQVSESATTWQIFRKMEYAAGMPQDILSAARSEPSNRTRRCCNGFVIKMLYASHLPSVAWRVEERTDLSSAR